MNEKEYQTELKFEIKADWEAIIFPDNVKVLAGDLKQTDEGTYKQLVLTINYELINE